jgi:cell division protein FtsB
MKWIVAILILVILGLQYRLWFGEGSFEQIAELEREIEKQKMENASLQDHNNLLLSRIKELKQGSEGLEEKARQDLGMIKEGETFYYITETPAKTSPPAKKP